ncbi:unnamed protein product, partial [Mesorhabditis belari]|uniref:Globin family profile domain-containing protein n=1 Tax=Mesorhabditis belari TaxID=2138241 RepID=A0AAF3EIP3_9BILA
MGASTSTIQNERKEKVEKLFRQNKRSNRSRSLDSRSEKAIRPIGSSQSARYPKQRGAPNQRRDSAGGTSCGLSIEQKRAIEVCWFKLSERQIRKCSEDIFQSILQTDEDLLTMFRLDNVPKGKIRDSDFFKAQAANFAIVLGLVVTNLQENADQATEALRTLGAQHLNYNSRGFQMYLWDIFTDCFEQNCPTTFKSRFERESWCQMILYILQQMKVGYTNAKKLSENRYLTPPIRE